MKRAKLLLLAVLAFTLLPLQPGSAAENPAIRSIIVQGAGAFSVAPDQATLSIGIVTADKNADLATQENTRIAAAIQSYLLQTGIKPDKIATNQYTFYPVYNDNDAKTAKIIGYNVNNTISVTLDDLEKIGDVIDSSIRLGANTINSIQFSAKTTDEMKTKALQAAVKNAKEKAETIAQSLGKRLVNVISVTENGIFTENRRIVNYALKSTAMDAAGATPIQPGDIDISASVQITFEIQ